MTIDANCVKVHIVWTLVLYFQARLWMMFQKARVGSSARIARYVLPLVLLDYGLMRQSTEHDTVDCPLAEDVF